MVVTGDITQVDLQAGQKSGLVDAWEKLSGIDGLEFHEMTRRDIVRHRLVQEIVNAYEHAEHGSARRLSRPGGDGTNATETESKPRTGP